MTTDGSSRATATIRRLSAAPYPINNPDFFDWLIDKLGNPHLVGFNLYSPELMGIGQNLSSESDLQITGSPVYLGFQVVAQSSDIAFTPEKLKEIYRNQVVQDPSRIISTEKRLEREDARKMEKRIAVEYAKWYSVEQSPLDYNIEFDNYSIRGRINGNVRRDLFDDLLAETIKHHIFNKIELRFFRY